MEDMAKKQRPIVESDPHFPQLEIKILDFWEKHEIFKKSVRGAEEFVMYDGPPFANGLPHYGHFLTGFVKDTYGRYHTMCGKKVVRNFGWDCHGLPSEMLTEKELGISGRTAIEEYGVEGFNDHCRSSVLRYTDVWQRYVRRQARWVDFEHCYKTMDRNYMESVLWAFKKLYDEKLIYKSVRVMPYSWACETPVSDFETHMDDAYREKKSKAVTVAFRLADSIGGLPSGIRDVLLLAWTTTPWTLPSNLALAVGSDIEYSIVLRDGVCYVVATALAHKLTDVIGDNCIQRILGEKLIGKRYTPVFDYFSSHKNAFVILHGEFVSTEDGTGVVHLAPGFGEDDYNLCMQHDIQVVCPVDGSGRFVAPVTEYIGQQVFSVEDDIIKRLRCSKVLLKVEQYTHNYPHCWRTDTQLIYKAVDSWYLKVTAIRDLMIKNNEKIKWIPEHIKNGLFGKWLENARDWSISRNRYWGCPIPVWQSDDPLYPHTEVYGSLDELEAAFGTCIQDLHRPFIDQLVRPNQKDPTGRSLMRRVPEVLDCWFESGSMPYAHIHYPFDSEPYRSKHLQADFVVEYLAQTRGWFYTLLVLSTALFGHPPFMNCICHGVILGDGGRKLSKRLQNYADPDSVFDKFGADAMRWYMLSSAVMKGQPLVMDREASGVRDALRLVIKPLWNAYNFFVLYANVDNVAPIFSLNATSLLDRYIIAKCLQTVENIKNGLDAYDSIKSAKATEEFIEVLNNWYIRRSRDRFWRCGMDDDKVGAYNTLYSVLRLLCTAIAPLLPLITEAIYQGLAYYNSVDVQESIHLENFPVCTTSVDEHLIISMERVRDACNAALRIRNNAKIRVRQPLSDVTFVGVADNMYSTELIQLILDEVNVKCCANLPDTSVEEFANRKLVLNLSALGKRIPSNVQQIIEAVKRGEWRLNGEHNKVTVSDITLMEGEFTLKLEPNAVYRDNACTLSTNDALVILNLDLSKELIDEGIARDMVRTIQQLRKDALLKITDRIGVLICTDEEEVASIINNTKWKSYIMEQTLANTLLVESTKDRWTTNYHGDVLVSDGELGVHHDGRSSMVFVRIFKT